MRCLLQPYCKGNVSRLALKPLPQVSTSPMTVEQSKMHFRICSNPLLPKRSKKKCSQTESNRRPRHFRDWKLLAGLVLGDEILSPGRVMGNLLTRSTN